MQEYTLKEVETLTGRPEPSLRKLINEGKLAAVKRPKGKRDVWKITEDTLKLLKGEADKQGYSALHGEWLEAMRTGWLEGKPFSPKTIRNNKQGVENFWRYLNAKPSLVAIQSDGLRSSISSVPIDHEKQSCGFTTKEHMYKGVRSFTKFLVRKGYKTQADFEALRDAKPTKRFYPARKTVLRPNQLQALFDANENERAGRPAISRMATKVGFALMAYAGLRNKEVITLKLEDVDLHNGLIKVLGKGNKLRPVGIHPELKVILEQWLTHYRPDVDYPQFLIGRTHRPLHEGSLQKTIIKLRQKAGLDITLHGLRRTAATIWVSEGMPLPYAQNLLGHEQITTTQGYIMPDKMDAVKWLSEQGTKEKKPLNLLAELLKDSP